MYKHILVPLDGSLNAEQALEPAFAIAESSAIRVSLLAVIFRHPESAIQVARLDEQSEERARAYLRDVIGRLKPHNFPIDAHVQLGVPANVIPDVAKEHGVDLIVMSTHGIGADARDAVGSTAWKVLQRSKCPVHMVRARLEEAA